MLAPIDKVTRPGGNDTIQIIVTTACDRRWNAAYSGSCANCTQLLPMRKDYKFMSVECFTEAILSVKDWPGIVAMFGGNPSLHPAFGELCAIMAERIPPQRRGLWSNHTLKNGAIAAQTFSAGRLNLNAHGNAEAAAEMNRWFPNRVIPGSESKASWHSAILTDYRDFAIPESEWIEARERCDINQRWSGAIAERNGKPYAYFCEVAASLDGIRGRNSGIPAVPGWWKERMPAFEHQVKNCCDQGCGVPLRLKGHLDKDETYDVSPSWLQYADNPKVPIELHQTMPEKTYEATDYMQNRAKPAKAKRQ